MIEWITSGLLVVAFVGLMKTLRLSNRGNEIIEVAIDSLETLSSSQLDDKGKESELQKNSLKLFGLFFKLIFGLAVALVLPLGLLWLADRMQLISLDAVFKLTISPLFLIVSTLCIILWLVIQYRKNSATKDQNNSYSSLDQALHRMSFKTYGTQVSLANIEDKIFSAKLSQFSVNKPVFITGLPRAGTTLLLECLADIPEFATHCYRDMPFVLIPCLWNKYSRIFQRKVELQERAHGDGMQINPDSPEALEEVIWSSFWQRHYQADRIIPWDFEQNPEFDDFFNSHMSKVMLLRRPKLASLTRYISKNNANIARTATLRKLFPDSVIVIPFRHPLEHATSLLKQHLNFLSIHETDTFAKEYMKAIGHYDFGHNLCPIDFDNWLDRRITKDAQSLAFWLEYWVASYKHLLGRKSDGLNFFNYDSLCQEPEKGLWLLAETVESHNPDAIAAKSSLIGQPRPKEIDTTLIPQSLLQEVEDVYQHLQATAFN
ncbi:MAG: sulfotransferase [Cyanobacteria bacterium P01_F01_bin.143]